MTGTTYPANDPTRELIPRVALAAMLIQRAVLECMVGGRSVCCYPIETERQRQTCKGLVLITYVHIVISTNQQNAQKSVSGTPGFEKKNCNHRTEVAPRPENTHY